MADVVVKEESLSTILQDKSGSLVFSRCKPVTLTWKNLNVLGRQHNSFMGTFFQRKSNSGDPGDPDSNSSGWVPILKNVNGIIKPGQLVALMVASGAGKTTLLNALNQRNMHGFKVNGDMRVNGVHANKNMISNISAYVQQEDLFIGAFTVKETLIFQALLKLPPSMSKDKKMERVNEVLHELGLSKCENTIIGMSGKDRGISGGEAKRLAFASEILTNPRLLFCDEPTTGLDSYTAETIIDVLSSIANSGRTVVCTIHQPPSEIFAKFNHVMLLAGGRVAFYGTSKKALDFFKSQGYPCPNDFNPSDYFIQKLIIPSHTNGGREENRDVVNKLCDAFEKTPLWKKYKERIERYSKHIRKSTTEREMKVSTSSFGAQFRALFWRANLTTWRTKRVAITRLAQKVFMSIFVGLLYLQTPLNQDAIMNINGGMYFMLMALSMTSIVTNLRTLPEEFPLLIREHHNDLVEFPSKLISIIPLFVLDGVVFMTIVFWLVGLHPSVISFLGMVATAGSIEVVSCAFGTLLSTVAPSFPIALSIAGPVMTLVWVTGGLFANVGTMPAYISWIQYLSWWRLGFELFASFQWKDISNIPCDRVFNATCITDGKEVLDLLNFSSHTIAMNFGLLFALKFSFFVIGGISLKIRTHKYR